MNAKRQIGQKDPKVTNKKLKTVGEVIYATYNNKCKENFGKSLSDILILVPEAGLQKKLSPTEKKKIKRDQQRKLKPMWRTRCLKVMWTHTSARLAQPFEL